MSRAEMRLARSIGNGDYRGASARQPLLAPDPDPDPPFSRYGASGYRGPRRGRSQRHPDTMTSLFTRGGPGWAEIKLCLWMGLCYFFMFTAYLSSQTLASTLPIPPPANGDDAMFIVYITFTFSSFWSPVLVHRVGAKPCILMGFCMYGTYIAANLYPRVWTLYPGAAMVGLAASPLWVSQGIIITHISQVFARKRGEDDTTAHVGFFNGIFSMFMVMTGVVGNLVSSLVFDSYNGACSGGSSSGGSDSELLGEGEAAIPVPQSAVDWLFSIYLVSTVLAVLVAARYLPTEATLEDESKRFRLEETKQDKKPPSMWTTVNLLRERRMFLLAPIYAGNGLIGAFLSANFTKNVIEPNMGECNVGYVMAANYMASAVVSISIGRVSDLVGRPAVMGFAFTCLAIMFGVLKYSPPTSTFGIYSLAIVIGLGAAAIRTPLSAQLSANFLDNTEAAFAASEMCGTIASSLGFLFADSASLDAKLDVAAVLCVLGFAGYFAEAAGRQGPGTDLSPGRAVIPGGFASPKGAGGGGVSAALRQRAFYAMLAQVLFFCGVGNLVAELYYLRSCSRIFVLTTPDHEPPYCDNSAARNWPYWPKTRTMVYELLPTAWTIGFCSTVFMFGGIQRAIAGRRWHYMCSGATCPPWVEAVDHLELEHGWVSWWPTGTRSQLVRNYFVVRALALATQLTVVWCLPPLALLWCIQKFDGGWDGGWPPAAFIAFKVAWSMAVGACSVAVGFLSATQSRSFAATQRRLGRSVDSGSLSAAYAAT